MKRTTLLLAVVAASCFGTIGCQDARVTNLEQRVSRLEQTVQQLESAQNKAANGESERRAHLESCVAAANADFQNNLISNGKKAAKGYDVPVPVLAEMERRKQGKIEECRLLYSK